LILTLKKAAFGLEENANAQEWVTQELQHILDSSREIVDDIITNDPEPLSRSPSRSDIWSHFHAKIAHKNTVNTPCTKGALMVKEYLQMPYLGQSKSPLDFCETYTKSFEALCLIYHAEKLSMPSCNISSFRKSFFQSRTTYKFTQKPVFAKKFKLHYIFKQ
jgi:hypothetical protein